MEFTRKTMNEQRNQHCRSSVGDSISEIPNVLNTIVHGRMARDGHGLPKVLPGPAMPYPCTPCRRANPKRALQPFQGWPTPKAGCLRLSSTPLVTTRLWCPQQHRWTQIPDVLIRIKQRWTELQGVQNANGQKIFLLLLNFLSKQNFKDIL
jgi:hypothetical protein